MGIVLAAKTAKVAKVCADARKLAKFGTIRGVFHGGDDEQHAKQPRGSAHTGIQPG